MKPESPRIAASPDGAKAKPDRDLTADEGAAKTVSTVVSPTTVRPKTTTDGRLRIEFKPAWRPGDPDAERGTIEDVKAGKADMAWVGARVFDRLEVTSFQALLAPLLVDSYELEGRVFESGIPTNMLEGVEELGVVGIGVLPGPMRMLLGVSHPFLQP